MTSEIALQFSALYLIFLGLPSALNIMISFTFSTAWALETAASINFLYASVISALGLALIYAHDSLAIRVGEDWRADVIVRIQASTLFISASLVIVQQLIPQAFLLVAWVGAVTAAGVQMIEMNAADQAEWERRYNGANVLLAGYGSCLLCYCYCFWQTRRIKKGTIMMGRARHFEIWSNALQSDDRYSCFFRPQPDRLNVHR